MKTNNPKGQHYIPKMLLKYFCDDEGYLWVGDTTTKQAWKSKPCNAFKVTHLYTRSTFSTATGGSPQHDFKYEEALSKLESVAAPIVERVLSQARRCECPSLTLEEETAIKEFMFAMARRTPESQQRAIATQSFEDIYYKVAKQVADSRGYVLPDKKELYEDLQVVRHLSQVGRNVFARFAAGDDQRTQHQAQKFCSEIGLGFVIIGLPNRSFVIGSHGIGILEFGEGEHHGYLPLAHDLCVWPTPYPDRTILHVLDQRGDWLIKKMQKDAVTRSQRIAGNCERLIRSLMESG